MDSSVWITLYEALGCAANPDRLPEDHIAAMMHPVAALLMCSPDDAAVFLLTGRHPSTWNKDWRDAMSAAIPLAKRAGATRPDRARVLLGLLRQGQASVAATVARTFLAADANAWR